MSKYTLALAGLMLAGCGDKMGSAPDEKAGVIVDVGSGRFKIERVGKFKDDLAYNGKRGVYVIVDTKTGAEFVGVSGVGISELGSHGVWQQTGKTGHTVQVGDER